MKDIIKDIIIVGLVAAISVIFLTRDKETQTPPTIIKEAPVQVVDNSKDLKKIIAQKDSALNSLLKRSDQVKTYVKIQEKFRVDTLKIFYTDTIVRVDTIEKILYKRFIHQDSTFLIAGKVTDKYVKIDSLEANVDVSLALIKRRGGLFRRRKYTVVAVSNNPHVHLKGVTSLTIQDKSSLGKIVTFSSLGFVTGLLVK